MIEMHRPSVCYYDASGALIHVASGYDYRWNFPMDYSEIPEDMIRFVLAVEDRNYMSHHGFDFWATLRASKQLLMNGRIMSGASTITMQTMTMFTGRSRTLRYKLRQIILACNWELSHSKEETLTLYFNNLPYGGKIYGLETAAQFYFGRHARELNRSEMILLAGLPQGPALYRPDRHPARAVQRRDVVLHLLVKNGAITPKEADEIRHEPLRYRDFNVPCWPHLVDTQYIELAAKSEPGKNEYRLALDSDLQNGVRNALRGGLIGLSDVKDGAAVVIENSTGYVRACVGTLDYSDAQDGKVNAAVAWRSPGSALKPFIYGEAIYGGLITSESILKDERLLLDDYRPDNFDGTFRGNVTATEALADSLNTPAVRVLMMVGVERELELLNRLNLLRNDGSAVKERIGLTLAIGGAESRLLNLTGAYSRLAGGPGKPLFIADALDNVGEEESLWTPGVREMLLEMIRYRPMPGGGGIEASWKTGTSNGNRDAWCFAVTPKWTVGVWYGNKSGVASSTLIGGSAAAPVAAAILRMLHKGDPPIWRATGELKKVQLCRQSGLRPGSACVKTGIGTVVAGIPLRTCEECLTLVNQESQKKTTVIIHPMSGEYLANKVLEDGRTALEVQLDISPSRAHLYIDGNYAGIHTSGNKVSLPKGSHIITVWPNGEWTSAQVSVEVK